MFIEIIPIREGGIAISYAPATINIKSISDIDTVGATETIVRMKSGIEYRIEENYEDFMSRIRKINPPDLFD